MSLEQPTPSKDNSFSLSLLSLEQLDSEDSSDIPSSWLTTPDGKFTHNGPYVNTPSSMQSDLERGLNSTHNTSLSTLHNTPNTTSNNSLNLLSTSQDSSIDEESVMGTLFHLLINDPALEHMTPAQLSEKIKGLEEWAFSLGVQEKNELQRSKVLNILQLVDNCK